MANNYASAPVTVDPSPYKEPLEYKGRIQGLSLFIVQIGCLVAYGLAGSFFIQTDADRVVSTAHDVFVVVMMALFVLVGFGMLLSAYRFGNWLGMATAIIVVALSVQLSPLLQKFWFSVFLTGFGTQNGTSTVGSNVQDYYRHFANNNIELSSYLNRVTFLSCISLLTVMTALVGRVTVSQIVKTVSLYQIAWNLNYFLLIYIAVIGKDHSEPNSRPFFFDAFGSTYVYLFAAAYGLMLVCFAARRTFPFDHPRNEFNRISLVMSAIGTAFIFAAFVFTTHNLITFTTFGNNLARYNILWSLTGGVFGTYIGSALCGKGRVGYKEALVGTISGGVIIGSAAPLIHSIGLVIMIGAIGGLFSGIYMRIIHTKINKNNVRDFMGLFGPFLICSFLGSFVVTPSALAAYYNRGELNPGIGDVYPYSLMGWQLVYVGITIAIGLISGLITGLFYLCDKDEYGIASNARMFDYDFGLYTPTESETYVNPAVTQGAVVYSQTRPEVLQGSSNALNTGNL